MRRMLPRQLLPRRVKKWLFWIGVGLFVLTTVGANLPDFGGSSPPAGGGPDQATVERVVDGDTAWFRQTGGRVKVRLLGIDTPESVPPRPAECYGKQASRELHRLLPVGRRVTLEYDRERLDRYQRTLAYVRLSDGRMVNLLLVEGGFAEAYPYRPNTRHARELREAEGAAKAAGRGLWAACAVGGG